MGYPSLFLYLLFNSLCWVYLLFDFQDRLSSPHSTGLSHNVFNLDRSEGQID